MRKILLSGLPATGKSTVSNFMAENHGFRHIDMEADGWASRTEFYKNTESFLGSLATEETGVVIDWGFGPRVDMEGVATILDEGYAPVWLDGPRAIPLYHFARRERLNPHRLKSYFGQVHAINTKKVIETIEPVIINPFERLGNFRPVEATAEDVIAAAEP